MNSQEKQHENLRKKLWIDVYVAYCSTPNSLNNDGGYIWANNAIKRFDEQFKPKPPCTQSKN